MLKLTKWWLIQKHELTCIGDDLRYKTCESKLDDQNSWLYIFKYKKNSSYAQIKKK